MKNPKEAKILQILLKPRKAELLIGCTLAVLQVALANTLMEDISDFVDPTYLRRDLDDLVFFQLRDLEQAASLTNSIVLVGGSGCREAIDSTRHVEEQLSSAIGQTRIFKMCTSGQTYLLSLAITSALRSDAPLTLVVQVGASILGAGAYKHDFRYPLPMHHSQELLLGSAIAPSRLDFFAIRRIAPILHRAYLRWRNSEPALPQQVHFYQGRSM